MLFIVGAAAAQNVVETGLKVKVPETYDRSSITYLVLDYLGDYHFNYVRNNVNNIYFSEKYYNNNLNYLTLTSPFERSYAGTDRATLIQAKLNEQRVANKIVAMWYSMDSEGRMNLDLVHSRGMFNATDDAYLQAKTTKRGNAQLEDYGNRLIDRSYVIVVDYYDIKSMEEAKIKDMRGWQTYYKAYLFKIDFNEETRNKIYDNWIYEEDTPEIKLAKKAALNKIDIPLISVGTTMLTATESQSTKTTGANSLLIGKPKSNDELMAKLLNTSYNDILYNLEMHVEHFRVITSIYAVKPLRAKIGRKEGLKTDNRYFAYEYVYDEDKDLTEQKFRGVIRSTSKIANNVGVATGKSPTSEFYQTAGKRLETGFLLQQKNDAGLELLLGYEIGEIGGVYGRLDYRLGRMFGVRALFAFVDVGFESKDYGRYNYAFLRYAIGFAKGYQVTHNIELRPYVGLGIESASNDVLATLSTVFLKGGINLNANLKHNIQLLGGVGFYSMGEAETEDGIKVGKWDVWFSGRKGMSILAGVKFGF